MKIAFIPDRICCIIQSMCVYPIFLSLADSRLLVAGAGKVGKRKIAGLCDAGAKEIFVFDPYIPDDDVADLQALPGVRVFRRATREGDIAGCALVFVATDDVAENARLAAFCKKRGILCNVADAPERGSFHVPACARVEELTVAFSTGGHSPALASRLRKDAAIWLKRDYGSLLALLVRLRSPIRDMDDDVARHGEIFRSLVTSDLGRVLACKDRDKAADILTLVLPPCLHGRIEEFLHGL